LPQRDRRTPSRGTGHGKKMHEEWRFLPRVVPQRGSTIVIPPDREAFRGYRKSCPYGLEIGLFRTPDPEQIRGAGGRQMRALAIATKLPHARNEFIPAVQRFEIDPDRPRTRQGDQRATPGVGEAEFEIGLRPDDAGLPVFAESKSDLLRRTTQPAPDECAETRPRRDPGISCSRLVEGRRARPLTPIEQGQQLTRYGHIADRSKKMDLDRLGTSARKGCCHDPARSMTRANSTPKRSAFPGSKRSR